MAPQPLPRVRRTSQNTQYTYNFGTRIYDVKTYPVLSPQGATILLYAHDNGVTVVWRGGRRLKPSPKSAAPARSKEKANGTKSSGDVIMLDSDSEDEGEAPTKSQPSKPFLDNPEFESAVHDGEYPDITQTLDLSTGTAALHLAVPPVTPTKAEDANWGDSELLKERMVFAISGSTPDNYLITLPLTPPSEESKARPELRSSLLAASLGSGQWNETVTVLVGQSKYSGGLAMSFAKPGKPSQTSERIRAQAGAALSARQPRIVVASHNREASGALRLWDVPFDAVADSEAMNRVKPFQTEYLPSPVTSISFNPTHHSRLLLAAPTGAVRVYDYAIPSLPIDEQVSGPYPSKGSWLLSLYQPFTRPTATRKPVIDAAWISHGRAVFVLLADGTWGIWDIEAASPAGSTIMGEQQKNSGVGVHGAALTVFSASGFVEGTSPLRGVGGAATRSAGDFVPMTPHSRRETTASLSTAATPERLASVKGGISVTAVPGEGSRPGDETVVMWIGGLENVVVVPSVAKFWEAQLRKTAGGGVGLFHDASASRMIRLLELSVGLLGERCCGVNAAVDFGKLKEEAGGLRVDVVVRGESRLTIVRGSDEEVGGDKLGGMMPTSRRLFSQRGAKKEAASAIIVHGKPDIPKSQTFDLTVRKRRSAGSGLLSHGRDSSVPRLDEEPTHDLTLALNRPKSGFGFNLDAAADAEDGTVAQRSVEDEMLDIMDIDRALDTMEGEGGNGGRRVFFQ